MVEPFRINKELTKMLIKFVIWAVILWGGEAIFVEYKSSLGVHTHIMYLSCV